MDPKIVNAKLESLARCIRRIESNTPQSVDALAENWDSQDIIVLNLERAVQLSVDIGSHILLDYQSPTPDSMAGVFLSLAKENLLSDDLAQRLAKAAGFRNIAVHEYQSIDWAIVYSIITSRLDDFRLFADQMLNAADKG